jgi:hypothetical protein
MCLVLSDINRHFFVHILRTAHSRKFSTGLKGLSNGTPPFPRGRANFERVPRAYPVLPSAPICSIHTGYCTNISYTHRGMSGRFWGLHQAPSAENRRRQTSGASFKSTSRHISGACSVQRKWNWSGPAIVASRGSDSRAPKV